MAAAEFPNPRRAVGSVGAAGRSSRQQQSSRYDLS